MIHARTAPAIDVVIPTYNRIDLLPTAIASIQAQTVAVARIYVVDDGSTDATAEWVLDAARRDPRIELVRRQRGGANRARNAAIALSQAGWIAFLDSDDAWEPDKLERQVALLAARPGLVGVFSGFRQVGGEIERLHIPRDDPSLEDLRRANVLGSTSAALLEARALRDAGGFDPLLPSCQDWDLWFRLRRIGPIGVVRQPLVLFNNGPHERITTSMEKVLDGHRVIFERLLEGVDGPIAQRRVLAGHRLVEADIQRRFGDHGQALGLALRSILLWPSKWALVMTSRILREMGAAR